MQIFVQKLYWHICHIHKSILLSTSGWKRKTMYGRCFFLLWYIWKIKSLEDAFWGGEGQDHVSW